MRTFQSVGLAFILALSIGGVSQGATWFLDEFNGTELDPGNWNTQIKTSGVRWVSHTVTPHHSAPGDWIDVSLSGNYYDRLPYGAVDVLNGGVSFSSGYQRTFPYVWSGPPFNSPFPDEGDFALEVRMKYDMFAGHGTGFVCEKWDDTTPEGDNPPIPAGQGVLLIWADTGGFLRAGLGDAIPQGPAVPVNDIYGWHTYRLEYVQGFYTLFVDGARLIGPSASAIRPNTLWMGNPVHTYWSLGPWTGFTVDYVKVESSSIEASLDVKPGCFPNSVNLKANGLLPVAILSDDSFDAATIDPLTVTVASAPVKLNKQGRPLAALEDVNDDGLLDLLVHVPIQSLVLEGDQPVAELAAFTYDGAAVTGSDTVKVVP